MSIWKFQTPARVEQPLSYNHPLWCRVREKQGVALVQHADGSWAEYAALPQNIDANADYMFGRTERSQVPRGRGFGVSQDGSGEYYETPNDREWESALRIYRGGHIYYIDDALKAELEAVETAEEPDGYGDYIVAEPLESFTGDEIILSGRTIEYEQGTAWRGES